VSERDDVIYGVHVVEEALASEEPLRSIHIAAERRNDPHLRRIFKAAEQRNIPVRFEARGYFAQFARKAHQSVVAIAPAFAYVTLEEVMSSRKSRHALFVLLDHLTDPHNVGAVIRSAECFGADAVILPDRRSAGVNATVRKAAAGAAQYLPIAQVGNLNQTIRRLKQAGVWVLGAAAGTGSVPLAAVDVDRDVALVIGAEGDGLAALVRRECDELVAVPMVGRTESLNASVAAGVLLYEMLRRRTR
jgi:23S rRNA (guanosine2251-2'-O)-methyltransferase